MLYLFAILCPPLAVLFCGKPIQALLNFILCICLWIPGVIHACLVVSTHKAEQRTDRMIKGITAGQASANAMINKQQK